MHKMIKLAVKLSLAFIFFTAINSYTEVSAMAANRVIKVNNDDSKEIRIKEDDFITFVPRINTKKGKSRIFIIHLKMERTFFSLAMENTGLIKRDLLL